MPFRFIRLLLLLPLCLLAACATSTQSQPTAYYHVSVLNLEGGLIASWTAAGPVKRGSDRFYRFDAVEHTLPNPARTYHYPLGWKVSIAGPRIAYYRVEKPEWLRKLGPLEVADAAEARAGDPKEISAPRQGE